MEIYRTKNVLQLSKIYQDISTKKKVIAMLLTSAPALEQQTEKVRYDYSKKIALKLDEMEISKILYAIDTDFYALEKKPAVSLIHDKDIGTSMAGQLLKKLYINKGSVQDTANFTLSQAEKGKDSISYSIILNPFEVKAVQQYLLVVLRQILLEEDKN